jgi:hypothetical protein
MSPWLSSSFDNMNTTTVKGDTASGNSNAPERQRLLVVLGSALLAGAAIGSGSSGTFHWDRIMGPISAGAFVALVAALFAGKMPVLRALAAAVVVVASCLATITLRHWLSGHWPLGHIDGKWPFVSLALAAYVGGTAAVVSLILAAIRRRRVEPVAAGNAG